MFGIAAINRMLRRQQEQQEIEYKVEDAGLNVRQLSESSLAATQYSCSQQQLSSTCAF